MAKFVIYDTKLATKTDLKMFGVPDGHMFSLEKLVYPEKFDPEDRIELSPGNSYMMIGQDAYKWVKDHYHLGLRKVTYYQVCDLPKVSTRDGINFTFVPKVLGTSKFRPRLEFFLSKEFTRKLKDLPEKNKVITKDLLVGIKWLRKWIDGEWHEDQLDGWFGLDYETADVTNLNHKDICGVGIASVSRGIFIDFRFPKSPEEWKEFSKVYIEFCMKFRDRIFAYNAKFEFDRTNETFGEYVDFQDAGAMNIVDARQMIYYSLKFTAQYYTGVASWDDDFAFFEEYLHKEIFKKYENLDELMADPEKVAKMKTHFIDEDDFQEWVEITKIKPNYWGDRFWNQTSRNLGKYCILDAYYTLMIVAVQWPKYPELANVLTCDNLRLGSQLMATGCFIDDAKRDYYRKVNYKYLCFSSFKIMATYYSLKIHPIDQEFLNKLNPTLKRLIEKGFNPTKGPDFWKDIASQLVDENSETLVNEYNALYLLGEEVGNKLINFGKRYKKPLTNFTRSKKMRADLYRYRHMLYSDDEKEWINMHSSEISKIKSNKIYSKRLKMMQESELWSKEFDEVGINDKFMFGGKERSLEEISNILVCSKRNRNGWYKLGTPTDQKAMKVFLMNIMDGYPCAFTCNIYTRGKYLKKLGVNTTDPAVGYNQYVDMCKRMDQFIFDWYNHKSTITPLTDKQIEDLKNYAKLSSPNNIRKFIKWMFAALQVGAKEYDPDEGDPSTLRGFFEQNFHVKEFGDMIYNRLMNPAHSGFSRWSKVDSYARIKHDTNIFGCEYEKDTPYEIVTSSIKAVYMYSLYIKELTYLDGIFHKDRHKVNIIDKDLRLVKDPESEYTHINTKFNICRLKTKRSSSGFHTIPHASCIKGIIKAPKGYAMSYFDVSQAEPRTCAYLMEKDKMRECYETGKDLYYMTAAIMHNQTYEEFTARPDAKAYRSNFKTVLLGLLYGMGPDTLGGRINADRETAIEYINALFKTFPKLKPAISERQEYPLSHHRECMTFWGDKMFTDNGDEATKRRYGIK